MGGTDLSEFETSRDSGNRRQRVQEERPTRPRWREALTWGLWSAAGYGLFAIAKIIQLLVRQFSGDSVHHASLREICLATLSVPTCGFIGGCGIWAVQKGTPLPRVLKDSLSALVFVEILILGAYINDPVSIQRSIADGLNPFLLMGVLALLLGPWYGASARQEKLKNASRDDSNRK